MFSFFLKNALSRDFSFYNNMRIYQVMVSSFQDGDPNIGYGTGYGPSKHLGDLRGIINALDYIKGLGVNALWMTPVFDSTNGQGGPLLQSTGYFATNYFKIDPHFGDEKTFKELVDKAHAKGLYVILDGVFGHHGGVNTPSPQGNLPQGQSDPVSYPGSLPYFTEVAKYWIENYGIDGWRLDQCYQMNQNGHNYLHEIRLAVEEACDKRKAAGEKWGILGYVVGEDWDGVEDINRNTYSQDGLKSAFDFPSRYNIVQGIAQEESGAGGYGIDSVQLSLRSTEERGYEGEVYPNLFISNHDVWRFGNLIRSKYFYGPENDKYWLRYKLALTTQAAISGPITIYYGDEIGDITDCWVSASQSTCGANTYSDNCARTDGKISGFNTNQKMLHDYTAKLMKIRAANPSLYRGTFSNTISGNILLNCKYDDATGNKVVYAANFATKAETATYMVGGKKLTDLITGKVISSSTGVYDIELNGLECALFKVE